MIVIPVKEGENIDRALKKFKRKFEKTGVIKELRARQVFRKPSVERREEMIKAVYIQQLQIEDQSM
ncbi:MAG TPA: 30S ribosomal protein S21 [Marinilabiliales bacterium]|jgi:small subunit ribosomal protein S21|nr:MAG: 30S ribosomal protein S21 [Bacteroidetes bacterium GWA2_40_14]OFX61292.1 MAG: 30S ribosomal protein S21 [Bacteroidetes bacterium GWC2_40_13]OFX73010.1 MAG: 30S ribosomal protein S21 [Bacteroidetes bacterium GWD2_40_43]OFX92640.1 MAG: 30S ribosomal protein S21 [Bacteroidetes bacterium GWE2_40_63]OFY17497.1 MAG: 30S ribosomal protein S21 [Bacteroidetes bacterium GWF2_40_13]OFZ27569.1 MAG: 30S ribosomal protein S21 [Bacteroidetes bacterium RIFOXYC2_FULL_40_12]HAM97222.1 30S ribosomal pro